MKPTHVRFFIQWTHAGTGEVEQLFRWEGERNKVPSVPHPELEDGDKITMHAQFFAPKLQRAMTPKEDE